MGTGPGDQVAGAPVAVLGAPAQNAALTVTAQQDGSKTFSGQVVSVAYMVPSADGTAWLQGWRIDGANVPLADLSAAWKTSATSQNFSSLFSLLMGSASTTGTTASNDVITPDGNMSFIDGQAGEDQVKLFDNTTTVTVESDPAGVLHVKTVLLGVPSSNDSFRLSKFGDATLVQKINGHGKRVRRNYEMAMAGVLFIHKGGDPRLLPDLLLGNLQEVPEEPAALPAPVAEEAATKD